MELFGLSGTQGTQKPASPLSKGSVESTHHEADASSGERELRLERPLVSFDLETTGLDVGQDRVVEISCVKVFPDGRREVRTRRMNPEIPISEEASEVHGIRGEDIRDEPTFDKLAKSLYLFMSGCDLTGFNLHTFDLPLLSKEFERAGLTFPQEGVHVVDSRQIFMQREPRTLAAALQFYCKRELKDAHSAEADAVAAADVLVAQVERYEDLPLNVAELAEAAIPEGWAEPTGRLLNKGDEVVLSFGKHKNRSLTEMAVKDPDYLYWMLKSDFAEGVKALIRKHLDARQ